MHRLMLLLPFCHFTIYIHKFSVFEGYTTYCFHEYKLKPTHNLTLYISGSQLLLVHTSETAVGLSSTSTLSLIVHFTNNNL